MTHDRHLTYAEAAAELDVSESLIRSWKHRGLVVPVGIQHLHQRGSREVPVFRIEELRPLADAYHQRRAEREANADQPML
ncbi:hypothetical protein GCM10009737_08140 [Nocardioides lentus]|uniref:Helix-turn-helix domain-containing protein n=1 Tax=Nocardioides lentus TaxID=338077 RepID=A0ABN2P474_9ACTN